MVKCAPYSPVHKAYAGIISVKKIKTAKSLRILQYRTRQAMYVQRNIEARSRNHFFPVKAISITYSEWAG
jgi:hypothetical protein